MLKERVIETNEGIQGEIDVAVFDEFARHMRDMGLTEAKQMIKEGITGGKVLEIGPGPGYNGLEWLKNAYEPAGLTGIEISANMIKTAQKNAREYGLEERCEYVEGNAMSMPFEDGSFDAAISSGSLHEWEEPAKVMGEAYRVLKSGGKLFISDMKRNISPPVRFLMWALIKPRSISPGFKSSLAAAYTAEEIERIARETPFKNVSVKPNPFGLTVVCVKE
jgi:ubiquinone/menaquinone biosynthesis C-methylase UbiE